MNSIIILHYFYNIVLYYKSKSSQLSVNTISVQQLISVTERMLRVWKAVLTAEVSTLRNL